MRLLILVFAVVFLVAFVAILILRRTRSRVDQGLAFPLSEAAEAVAKRVEWPQLPRIEHTADKAATRDDVLEGRAIFALEQLGVGPASRLPIPLPQYAFHVDKARGVRRPVVVVQAEAAGNGMEILGYQSLDGKSKGAGLREEFELLGTELHGPP